MAEKKKYKLTAVITDRQEFLDRAGAILSEAPEFTLLDLGKNVNEVLSSAQVQKPDIFVLDFSFDNELVFDLIDNLTTKFPDRPLVVVFKQDEVQNSNSVVLAGARAFVVEPFTDEVFLSTLHRLSELSDRLRIPEQAIKEAEISPGDSPVSGTFVIFSPKGGAGCTSAAVNLAIALRKFTKDEVVLVDGKHQFGHVSLALNIRTVNSIVDLLSHAGSLDDSLVKQVTLRHQSGIDVLPAPNSIAEAQGIRPEDLFKVVTQLQKFFPLVCVDAGNYLHENTVTYMDIADFVIVVLTPDIASLRDVRKFIDVARSLSYPREKIQFFLNRTGKKNTIKVNEIERVLKVKVLGSIPTDDTAMSVSMNEGIPISLRKPRHPISRAYMKIAQALIALARKKKATPSTPKGEQVLDRSSKLG